MRYTPEQKEETKKKILEAAGESFRSHGYAGVGVDGLAKHAGVTSGAFYSNFKSKKEAFDAALSFGLDEVITALPKFQQDNGSDWIKAFAQYYLSKSHRKDLACGCAMATLTSEVVRADTKAHTVYENKMLKIVDLIADGLSGGSEDEKLVRAWSFLSILIGGINVVRALKTASVSDDIAMMLEESAINAAGKVKNRF